MSEQSSGPYVQVAAFCEQVIQDTTGSFTLVRLIDRSTVSAAGHGAPDTMPRLVKQPMNLFLGLKPGTDRGPHRVKVTQVNPDGSTEPLLEFPIQFEGPTRGVNGTLHLTPTFAQPGLYWFDIELGGRVLTRVPYEVVYELVKGGQLR